jgi:NTE family protein
MARLAPRWWNWGWMAFNPFGQRNFFSSRLWPLRNPWLTQWRRPLKPDELAFYPTGRLEKTLDRHVAWEKLSDGPWSRCRLSLGAARVTTGDVVFFDSSTPHRKIGARHVLASGALPPAFPPVRVKDSVVDEEVSEDDALYWDGGVSSNTPIEWIAQELLDDHDERDTIVFLIDVWDRKGPVPKTIDEACWRQKSIQYGSRKDAAEAVIHDYRLRMQAGHADAKKLEICHVLYERSDGDPQFAFSDADFSRETYRHLRTQGAHDMAAALREPDVVPVAPLIYEDSVVLYRYGTEHKHRDTDGAHGRRPRRSRRVRLHCAGEQDDGPLASQRK